MVLYNLNFVGLLFHEKIANYRKKTGFTSLTFRCLTRKLAGDFFSTFCNLYFAFIFEPSLSACQVDIFFFFSPQYLCNKVFYFHPIIQMLLWKPIHFKRLFINEFQLYFNVKLKNELFFWRAISQYSRTFCRSFYTISSNTIQYRIKGSISINTTSHYNNLFLPVKLILEMNKSLRISPAFNSNGLTILNSHKANLPFVNLSLFAQHYGRQWY